MPLSARSSVRPRERFGPNGVSGVALGDGRQPARIGERPHGGKARVASSGPVVASASSRSAARSRVSGSASPAATRPSTPGSHDSADRRAADPSVRVGFCQDRQFGRVVQFSDGFQTNGGVRVLPTGLWLELV